MGTYDYSKIKSGLIPSHCPNYREKSKGLFKGHDKICACSGNIITNEYASNICLFFKEKGSDCYIKYDTCSNYRKYGVRNGR